MSDTTEGPWLAWNITVFNGDGEWRWCELDPAQALAKARMQQFTEPVNDRFGEEGALKRLLAGETIHVWCLDGTQIIIEPTTL